LVKRCKEQETLEQMEMWEIILGNGRPMYEEDMNIDYWMAKKKLEKKIRLKKRAPRAQIEK